MSVASELGVGEELRQAAERWRAILGSSHVVMAGDEITRANLATFEPVGRVVGIIRPSSRQEVQACLQVAHELHVRVYPVSCGRNWGYGSRTPPTGSAVVMELARMNQVLEFSEDLAFVRVQPGVTFEQLSTFLEQRGSALQMEATAGPQDGSIIGNALERGRSHGPGTLTGRPVADFEIVLADGRVVHTSSRRFGTAAHAATEPFPVGPDLTGMFFESNLGVVTEMTLWLSRRPKYVWVLRLGMTEHDALRSIVPIIRGLMLDGILASQNVLVVNEARWRHSARFSPHTVNEYEEQLPLWPERNLAWLCQATLYASDQQIVERRLAIVRDALSPYAAVACEAPLTNVGAKPFPEYLRNPLWTKATPEQPDLDRDRIGYIFLAPVVPADSDQVMFVYQLMRDLMITDGFEPYINIRFWEARSVLFVGAVVYDLEEAGADARAVRCSRRVLEDLGARGYLAYRLPTFAMQNLPAMADDSGSLWAALKRACDPHDILSPGRYDFRYSWPRTS